jgi:hypothetical protein
MTFWYYENYVFRYDPVLPATRFYFRGVDGGVGDSKDSFYEELEQVFDHFPRYDIKILLGNFKAKVGKRIFSNRQLGMRVYIRLVMIIVL